MTAAHFGPFRALPNRLGAVLLGAVCGCTVPVATDLSEPDANRIVVALESSGVATEKELDPIEGGWRVLVPKGAAASAATVLEREGLPPRLAPGVLEVLGTGSLVPSRTSEHAKWLAGTAGDLERSLHSVEGILSVRVHLAVPPQDLLAVGSPVREPTASVLIRHRGARPPLPEKQVQRLVSGAVPGLAAERVSVVSAEVSLPGAQCSPDLVSMGPVRVTRPSAPFLRAVALGVLGVLLALLALLLLLWARLRRLRQAAPAARPLTPEGSALE